MAQDKSTNVSPLPVSVKIEIMLHEYDTLRDEVVENLARQPSTLAIMLTIFVSLLGLAYTRQDLLLQVFVPTIMLVFLTLEASRQFSLWFKSNYLRILERQINFLAGEPLLMWEHAGSLAHFYNIRIKNPSTDRYVFNSHTFLLILLSILYVSIFFAGLYMGGVYIYVNTKDIGDGLRFLLVSLYEISHLFVFSIVLFSRIIQEKKIIEAHKSTVVELRDLPESWSNFE